MFRNSALLVSGRQVRHGVGDVCQQSKHIAGLLSLTRIDKQCSSWDKTDLRKTQQKDGPLRPCLSLPDHVSRLLGA